MYSRCLLGKFFGNINLHRLPPAKVWRDSCNSLCSGKEWTVIMNQTTANDTQLGFVGVGAMGSRIVRRLLAHGYKVAVYDRARTNAARLIADGATVSDSLENLAGTADVILSCLTDDAAVREVYLASNGILAHAAPGTVVVEMSTIRPETSRQVAREGAARGVHVLD